jgi:D-alanine transaminase
MGRTVYLNGEYLDEAQAKVSIFDRALLFSDALYEVTSVLDGKLIDFKNHMKRLDRSMTELNYPKLLDHKDLELFHRELVKKNNLKEGVVYLQVSRGVAERSFDFPDKKTELTVSAFTQVKDLLQNDAALKGIKVMTIDDMRWKRCDIKTVQLLYPSFAKSSAVEKGFDDAWMVRNGYITEGTSNNAWIIRKGTVITRQFDNLILRGITREAVIECAEELNYKVDFKNFTINEAQSADEAFVTSATTFVTPVIKINKSTIGDGKPGKFTKLLREKYIEKAKKIAI